MSCICTKANEMRAVLKGRSGLVATSVGVVCQSVAVVCHGGDLRVIGISNVVKSNVGFPEVQ